MDYKGRVNDMKKYNNIMVGLNSNNEIVCINYVELRDREEIRMIS